MSLINVFPDHSECDSRRSEDADGEGGVGGGKASALYAPAPRGARNAHTHSHPHRIGNRNAPRSPNGPPWRHYSSITHLHARTHTHTRARVRARQFTRARGRTRTPATQTLCRATSPDATHRPPKLHTRSDGMSSAPPSPLPSQQLGAQTPSARRRRRERRQSSAS